MRFLSLFSGFGAMDLGLERAGWACVAHVEANPYARGVLARHWPGLPCVDDVRKVRGDEFGPVSAISGGPPCQPVSDNGKKKAQDDARWLWPEFLRIVRRVRPDWLLLENVTGLLKRGFGDVVGGLAAVGYDAEWDCVPAAAFGAPHLRDRVFLVSYPAGAGSQGEEPAGRVWGRGMLAQRNWWRPEPGIHRVAHGTADRVERTIGLGNAVVVDVAEWIGRRIVEASPAPRGGDAGAGTK